MGITRAQQTLTMSLTRKRKQFGEMIDCEPSRFLDELPADDISWQGGLEQDEEAAQQRANDTLAGLKELLA